ncbi:MAG TPA: OpgC domain-containing protein, partial [Phycisphaerales bacterium]|nr:OpgC domain-containing protein [Phycisphaerales bacterium]
WGWYNRMGLAPVPVISFTAFAYVVMCITVKFWPEHPNAFLGLFVQCGARSLPVFCVGVAATYLVAIAMQPLTRTAGEYVVLFAAMGSLLLVPKVLAMREGSKRVLPRSAEPIPARVPVAALSQAQAFEQNAPLQPVVTSAAKNVLESPKPVPVEI